MTWLLQIAQSKVKSELPDEVLDDLVYAATEILRSGVVTVSPMEWAVLSGLERSAFVYANEAIEIERAVRVATAILGGPAGMAEISKPLDDGKAEADLALRAEMRKFASELKSGNTGVKV